LRVALLGANFAASLGVLVNWWLAVWPNLAAAWFQTSAIVALAMPLSVWVGRVLDTHHDRVAAHQEREHAATRQHVEERLATHAAAHDERMAVISDQIAALHAKLDQPGGTP
jgi:predicted membrane-bound mannosyltransferase